MRGGATYLSLLIYREKPKEPEVSDLKPTIPVVGVEPAFNPGHSDIADPSDEKAVSDLKPASPSLDLDPTNWKGTAMNAIAGLGAHHRTKEIEIDKTHEQSAVYLIETRIFRSSGSK